MCRWVIAFTRLQIKFSLLKQNIRRCDTSISTVTKPEAEWPRNLGLIPGRHRDFSIVHSSRSALGLKWKIGTSLPGFKVARVWSWPLPPSCVEINSEMSYTSTPTYIFTAWCTGASSLHLFIVKHYLTFFLSKQHDILSLKLMWLKSHISEANLEPTTLLWDFIKFRGFLWSSKT